MVPQCGAGLWDFHKNNPTSDSTAVEVAHLATGITQHTTDPNKNYFTETVY
jgi:hypothetical protein